ncbi:MAG: hypothetical protein SF002_19190 [Alphaproteobacteria bacterium]|nr:hypothetical protein [Alphaproteobacteria bacterium]
MSDPIDPAGDRRLWQRVRLSLPEPPEPDLMTLAAYAEGRLADAEAEAVEAWLIHHPEALADIAAARSSLGAAPAPVPLPVVRAARTLAPSAQRAVWPQAMRWSSFAAAVVLVAFLGFQMGVATATSLIDPGLEDLSVEEEVFL